MTVKYVYGHSWSYFNQNKILNYKLGPSKSHTSSFSIWIWINSMGTYVEIKGTLFT